MKDKIRKTKYNRHLLINKLVGNEEHILDIGFAQHANLLLKNPVGVDIQVCSPPNYKKTYKVNLNHERLPFNDKIFRVVIASEIIEHVENPSFVLREINRVLKNKGRLIISTPNANYYWSILRNTLLYFIADTDIGQHLSNWTITDFQRILKLNGFEIKKMYGSYITIPYINLKLKQSKFSISMESFPRLSYLVLYDCIKIGKPSNKIFTQTPHKDYSLSGNGGDWIEIDNKISELIKFSKGDKNARQ